MLQWSPGRTLGIDLLWGIFNAATASLQWSPGRTLGIDTREDRGRIAHGDRASMEPRANPGNRPVEHRPPVTRGRGLQWSPGRTLGIDRGPEAPRRGRGPASMEPRANPGNRREGLELRPPGRVGFNGAQGEPWESTSGTPYSGRSWEITLQWSPGRTLGIDVPPQALVERGAWPLQWSPGRTLGIDRVVAVLAVDRVRASMEPRANPGNRLHASSLTTPALVRLQWSPGRTLGIDSRTPTARSSPADGFNGAQGEPWESTLGGDGTCFGLGGLQWSPGRTLGIDGGGQ